MPSKPRASDAPKSPPRSVTLASGYVVTHRAQISSEEEHASPMKDLVLPLVLLALGVIGRLAEVAAANDGGGVVNFICAFCGILVATLGLSGGVFATAKFMGSELPSIPALARGLIGIAAFSAALGAFLASFDRDPLSMRGMLISVHVAMLLNFALLSFVLRLDLLEALISAVIALLVQIVLFLAISSALPPHAARLLFNGA